MNSNVKFARVSITSHIKSQSEKDWALVKCESTGEVSRSTQPSIFVYPSSFSSLFYTRLLLRYECEPCKGCIFFIYLLTTFAFVLFSIITFVCTQVTSIAFPLFTTSKCVNVLHRGFQCSPVFHFVAIIFKAKKSFTYNRFHLP